MREAGSRRAAQPNRRLWHRNFILLLLTSHLIFAGQYSLFALIPSFLDDFSNTTIGFVVGAAGFTGVAARMGSAPLADRIGRRRILLAGLALGVLAHLLFLQGPSPAGLIPARLIYGLSWGLMSAAWPPLSADFAPASRRGEAIGYTIAATESALLYAPFVLLLIAESVSFRVVYVGLALLLFTGFLIVRTFPDDRPRTPARSAPLLFRAPRAALIPFLGFLGIPLALGAQAGFLILHVDENDLGDPQLFFFSYGALAIIMAAVVGRIDATIGYRATAVGSALFAAGSMLIVALAEQGAWLLLAGAFFGIAFSGGYTAATRMAYESAAAAKRAVAVATVTVAFDVGILAPVLLGVLADATDTSAVFFTAAAIAAGCGLAPLLARRSATIPLDAV